MVKKKKWKRKKRPRVFHKKVTDEEKKLLKYKHTSQRNPGRRHLVHRAQLLIKKRMKREQLANRDPDAPRQQPVTLEMKREGSPSIVEESNVHEVREDELFDEFISYFHQNEKPKVLITTGHQGFLQSNREPPAKAVLKFVKDLLQVIPQSHFFDRKQYRVGEVIEFAKKRKFTFVIVIGCLNKRPHHMIMSHLPDGPTACFRISTYCHSKEIKGRADMSDYYPELIMNNFTSRLGLRVGRMLQAMFPQKPEFKGRRVVTFHNQRDFVFFRHHRYQFENRKDVIIQEIGPRFTLRVLSLQLGTFDPRFAEFEWFHNRFMDTSKRKFFL